MNIVNMDLLTGPMGEAREMAFINQETTAVEKTTMVTSEHLGMTPHLDPVSVAPNQTATVLSTPPGIHATPCP